MPKRQRVAVLGIFMLASFVVIASVVRIVMLEKNTQSKRRTEPSCTRQWLKLPSSA